MSDILEILEDAHVQAQELAQRNPPGEMNFWRLIRTYNQVALELAHHYRDDLAPLSPRAVFSPPVFHQPRLRPLLAPYDLHRYLYFNALSRRQMTELLEALRACDAVIDRIFLGFPEPGYLAYPGLLGYLADPEEELEDVRLQEVFIARRLELSREKAAEHLTRLERSLEGYLSQAAMVTRSVGVPKAPRESKVPPRKPGLGRPGPSGSPPPEEEPGKAGYGYDFPMHEETGSYGGPLDEDPPPPPPEDGPLYRVWYATTRKPVEETSPRAGYAPEADPQERIHHGYCDVLIPESHRFGSVGSGWLRRWLRPWRPDDRLHIEQYARLEEALFLSSLRREFAKLDREERVALVYIHGYRTSFDEAAIRAAQIGFDLKVPGITAFFSWHSRGELDEYLTDREAIQEAEAPLRRFLLQFATQVDAEKVHLIAHSMGNQGLARVIRDIAQEVTEESGKPFAQILLAAPDISQSLFRRLAQAYPKVSERTTLYISRKDKALWFSKWLQGTPRAGFSPPITVVDGIDTVEVTDIDLTMLGHGYFADAAPVLYDMKELIDDNKPPERRARLRQTPGPPPHWVIAK